jgi:hypothetical protein
MRQGFSFLDDDVSRKNGIIINDFRNGETQ